MSFDFTLSSNIDACKEIGRRLKATRLNADLSQQEVAQLSGVSESTIKRAETANGNITLLALIAILRALKKIDQLDLFLPPPPLNPIQLSASKGKPKQRASRKANSDAASDQEQPFQWGEE